MQHPVGTGVGGSIDSHDEKSIILLHHLHKGMGGKGNVGSYLIIDTDNQTWVMYTDHSKVHCIRIWTSPAISGH